MTGLLIISVIVAVIALTALVHYIHLADKKQQELDDIASKPTEISASALAKQADASANTKPDNSNNPTAVMKPEEKPPEAGTRIGEYTVISQIGFGGMGRIMKASAPNGKPVALKIIKGEHISNQALVDRFEQEMKISSLLSHTNVAEILGWGVDDDGRSYFAMEYVDGKNIRQMLEKNEVDLNKALNIFTQLCRGLKYAHGKKVIHRDIKPENLILDKNGILKIVDFGIARMDSPESANLTMTNVIMGSPIYMSPEQKSDFKNVDHRADIYAAGAVFYEMLSGEMPGGLLRLDLIPENLRAIVEKAIAYNANDRYADCDDILKDLEEYKDAGRVTNDQKAIRKIEDNVKLRQALIDSFYPNANPAVPGLDLDAFYIPAEGIGGNYYDYIKIDPDHTGILVGNLFDQPDVEAALFLAMLRSAFRLLAHETTDPGETLKKLNDFMSNERFDNFAVFSYMIFNSKTKDISVATAGYRPVMIKKSGAEEFTDLQPDGVGIGIMEDYDYETSTMKLQANDLILLSSAGLGKTVNREGRPFGDERLVEMVLTNADNEAGKIIEAVKNTILYYGAGTAQEDDITVVVAKVK